MQLEPEQPRQRASRNYTQYTEPTYSNSILPPIDLAQDEPGYYAEGYTATSRPPTSHAIPESQPGQQQQHYYAPIFTTPETGTDGKILAAFSYLGFWLTGLIVVLFVRENRFVRFHAIQSLVFYGSVNILWVVFFAFMAGDRPWHHTPFLFGLAMLAFAVMNIIAAVAWLVGIIGALTGRYQKFPFVGDFAEQTANPGRVKH